jgi:hypothetical protein
MKPLVFLGLVTLPLVLAGCAHQDLTAPCEPIRVAGFTDDTPSVSPADRADRESRCGEARPVNGSWRLDRLLDE